MAASWILGALDGRHVSLPSAAAHFIAVAALDVEISILAERQRYRIAQVPARWCGDGDSRLNLMAGNLKNVRDIFRFSFGRGAAPTHGAELAPSDRTEP